MSPPRWLYIPRTVEEFLATVAADQRCRDDARAAGRAWWTLEQECLAHEEPGA